jgi:hypothetical protein
LKITGVIGIGAMPPSRKALITDIDPTRRDGRLAHDADSYYSKKSNSAQVIIILYHVEST